MPKTGMPSYLTREAPQMQRITSGIPQPGSQLDRRALVVNIDKEKRTLELSFSSEIEVKRWSGFIEVLDHSRDAVDLTRLNSRGPLLFNHDLDEVIGVIENAEVASDRKGRALVRFGNSARAKEVWDDVQDGILSNVSVGYRIIEIKLKETRDNGDDVYVVTRWEPYEISIVSAPADTSVGVGRSAQPTHNPKKNLLMNRDQMLAWLRARNITVADDASDAELTRLITEYKPAAPAPAPAPTGQRGIQVGEDHSDAVKAERQRMADITAAAKKLKLTDLGERFVTEGKSVDEFRAAALEEITKRTASFKESQSPIGLTDKETRAFQFLRLVRSLCDPSNQKLRDAAGFEHEAVAAAAAIHKKATQRDAKGIIIPNDILRSRLVQGERDIVSIKDGAGYTGTGSNTVQTQLLASSYFELLREASTIMRLGTTLGGLVGNLDIPKEAADGDNAGWIGEDDEAPVSEITFGKISLSPKTVATTGSVTREMLMQSSLDVEAIFRRSLARAVARKIDFAGYYGDGTSNAPVGIRETDGVNYKPFAGDKPTWPELVDMETLIATENLDPRSARFVFNANMRGYLKQTKKFSTDATSMIMLENGEVNGYGHEMTNRIANGQVFFGDFAELLIGMWGGLDIVVDPYTHSNRGRVRLSMFQTVDFEVRRPEAFTFGARSTLS